MWVNSYNNIYNVCIINNDVRMSSMSNEEYDNKKIDDDSGWYSEPSIEYVI